MSVAISGMGWVTPLGAEIDAVWQALLRGEVAETRPVSSPTGRTFQCRMIDQSLLKEIGRMPRLRRSSSISYFIAAAGLAALADAGLEKGTKRLAVIVAVTDGGAIYTRRFFEKIAKEGASAASPLLFPETVYNAPASHVAAVLGLDGATYTLVGDATAGIEALKMGEQLIETGEADHCLVIGGEEIDWILCEAYHHWRLLGESGMTMAEGAAAVVLSREGAVKLERIDEGQSVFSRAECGDATRTVVERCATNRPDFAVTSANGTYIDKAERTALEAVVPGLPTFAPKAQLGESLGSSAIQQIIITAKSLTEQTLPGASLTNARRALVPVLGLNQQASAAVLARE